MCIVPIIIFSRTDRLNLIKLLVGSRLSHLIVNELKPTYRYKYFLCHFITSRAIGYST